MSNIKKNLTISSTNARLSTSVDFSGYIYPQFVTTSLGLPLAGLGTIIPGGSIPIVQRAGALAVGQQQQLLYKFLSSQSSTLLAGIQNVNVKYTREIYKRKQLGNYEYIQTIPGTIAASLILDKVVFYNNENILDTILDFNYDGSIKQTAPLMIVQNLEDPKGNMKSIMFLDCWIKNSTIVYNLSDKLLTVNNLAVECARTFAPIDYQPDTTTSIVNGVTATTSTLSSYNINIPNAL